MPTIVTNAITTCKMKKKQVNDKICGQEWFVYDQTDLSDEVVGQLFIESAKTPKVNFQA